MAVADPTQCVKHIEAYVNCSGTPTQQVESVNAIASLLKHDLITLEAFVREMEMYLTTTDNTIRSRGILLLGEVLSQLTSKPLSNTAVQSLIGFFTERLADWRALRGALVGSLALVRRKIGVGVVTDIEARAIMQSYMQNLQVQSLGKQDRKLCFELLECLLDRYGDAVRELGEDLVYGICEAIDAEKDPQCLLITFRITEILPRVFPDSSGPLSNFAADLFEILGSYFPIHFTHPKNADVDIRREELSKALMLAFASTPSFEPFAIPLLLEKLSSTLPSAKIESLKYLSYCTSKYGADRMAKHGETLWSSIKDTIYTSQQCSASMDSESSTGMDFQESEIMSQALLLLQEVIRQNDCLFSKLIVLDADIKMSISSMSEFKYFDDIPMQSKERLYVLGRILSTAVKSSIASCNKIFEHFFSLLMDSLGLSDEHLAHHNHLAESYVFSGRNNFPALYLCVELLVAFRELMLGFEESAITTDFVQQPCCRVLHSFSGSLTMVFTSILEESAMGSIQNPYIYEAVKGLQILAMFPGSSFPISKSIYEDILVKLMSSVNFCFEKTFLWESVLKALVEIGLFIHKCPEKATSFDNIVIEKIISLLSSDALMMPLPLKLHAIFDIGTTGQNHMLKMVQRLHEALSVNLSEAFVHGDVKSVQFTVKLLECYTKKVLPWFHNVGDSVEVPLHLAITIWETVENCSPSGLCFQDAEFLDATVKTMKLAVGNCSEEGQKIIVHKACSIISCLSSIFPEKATFLESEDQDLCYDVHKLTCREEWVVSLFASVMIALRPETQIPNLQKILQFFIVTLLNGHVQSAQALGSFVNKLPLKTSGTDLSSGYSLEEALDIIFSSRLWRFCYNGTAQKSFGYNDGNEICIRGLRLDDETISSIQIHAITGLAWVGKGLLMRGHEKLKDITLTFLGFFLSNGNIRALQQPEDPVEEGNKQRVLGILKSAADAFHILMGDSEACLNRSYHAIMRPLYKQRFFSTMMPILLSTIKEAASTSIRSVLYRAFAYVVCDSPLTVVLSEAKKLLPLLLDCISTLSKDLQCKDITYSLVLIMSSILMDKNGNETVLGNAHIILTQLVQLTSYSHMAVVRETAIQCLVAMSELPHARVYPFRAQVLQAMSKALDDPKRIVRQEAVRCRQCWASMA